MLAVVILGWGRQSDGCWGWWLVTSFVCVVMGGFCFGRRVDMVLLSMMVVVIEVISLVDGWRFCNYCWWLLAR